MINKVLKDILFIPQSSAMISFENVISLVSPSVKSFSKIGSVQKYNYYIVYWMTISYSIHVHVYKFVTDEITRFNC